jgi:hypothetical protein
MVACTGPRRPTRRSGTPTFYRRVTRFSDRVIRTHQFRRGTQILHIDIDPAEIGKNVPCYHALWETWGSCSPRCCPGWAAAAAGMARPGGPWRSELPPSARSKGAFRPGRPSAAVRAAVPRDAIVTTEVGQHQIWTAHYYGFSEPRTFLSSEAWHHGLRHGRRIGPRPPGGPAGRAYRGGRLVPHELAELATIANYDFPSSSSS